MSVWKVLACPRCGSSYGKDQEFCGIDGERLKQLDSDPLIGRTIDRYRILAPLGDGGMARVYRARHVYLDQDCAIKVLYGEVASDRTLARRFQREAQASSKIRHPNVVSIIDFGASSDGLIFMAMELIEGGTLADAIRSEGIMSPERASYLTRQIALGLSAAHDLGFIHRDLKPKNVMLVGDKGEELVKILDFGLVALTDEAATPDVTHLTRQGQVFGTPAYMAPEQISGTAVGPPTDLYALGIILYQLLSGNVPFNGPATQIAMMHISAFPAALPHLGGLGTIALRLLEKALEARPQDARNVVSMLDACVTPRDGQGRVLTPPPARVLSPRPARSAMSINTSDLSLPGIGSRASEAVSPADASPSRLGIGSRAGEAVSPADASPSRLVAKSAVVAPEIDVHISQTPIEAPAFGGSPLISLPALPGPAGEIDVLRFTTDHGALEAQTGELGGQIQEEALGQQQRSKWLTAVGLVAILAGVGYAVVSGVASEALFGGASRTPKTAARDGRETKADAPARGAGGGEREASAPGMGRERNTAVSDPTSGSIGPGAPVPRDAGLVADAAVSRSEAPNGTGQPSLVVDGERGATNPSPELPTGPSTEPGSRGIEGPAPGSSTQEPAEVDTSPRSTPHAFERHDRTLSWRLTQRGLNWRDLTLVAPEPAREWGVWRIGADVPTERALERRADELEHALATLVVDAALLESKLDRVRRSLGDLPERRKDARHDILVKRYNTLRGRIVKAKTPDQRAALLPEITLLENDAQLHSIGEVAHDQPKLEAPRTSEPPRPSEGPRVPERPQAPPEIESTETPTSGVELPF